MTDGAANYVDTALIDDGSCTLGAVCDIYEFGNDGVIYDVSDQFQCWSHPNCPDTEAALVSDGVMTVIDNTDIITAWPPYVSGTVYVSFTMTVPTGSSGYWNFGNQMPNAAGGWGWEGNAGMDLDGSDDDEPPETGEGFFDGPAWAPDAEARRRQNFRICRRCTLTRPWRGFETPAAVRRRRRT